MSTVEGDTSNSARLSGLQGLRFIAFLLIFLNHSFGYLGISKIFDFGARGVEIFFVLSGYLVAYNYGDREFDDSLKGCLSYAYKKVKKFYLLHFITFMLFLYNPLMQCIRGGLTSSKQCTLFVNSILNITLLKSWYFPSAFSLNGVTWFLSTILFAYLLVPKTVMLLRKRDQSFYMILFSFLLITKMILDTYGYRFTHTFHAFSLYTNPAYRFQDFLLGYVFYMASKGTLVKLPGNMHKVMQVCIPIAYLMTCFLFDKKWIPAQFVLLTCLLVYIISLENTFYNKMLSNKLFELLGNSSFEMFILHTLIIRYVNDLWRFLGMRPKGLLFWGTSLVITILVSLIVHGKPWKKINRELV